MLPAAQHTHTHAPGSHATRRVPAQLRPADGEWIQVAQVQGQTRGGQPAGLQSPGDVVCPTLRAIVTAEARKSAFLHLIRQDGLIHGHGALLAWTGSLGVDETGLPVPDKLLLH